MEEKIISARIDKKLYELMKKHDEVNWSAIIRKALISKVDLIGLKNHEIDEKRAEEALILANEVRKSKIFDGGKSSTEIIREWRDKRK